MRKSINTVIVLRRILGGSLLIGCVIGTVVLVRVRAAAPGTATETQTQESPPASQVEIERQKQRLSSTEVEERRDALLRLGRLRRLEASRVALTALNDPEPIVRATAASACSSLPPEEGAGVLIPLLSDKDEFVRREAAYALGHTRSRRAVPALVERLTLDKQDSVRGASATALGRIGDEAAVTALALVLSQPRAARPRKGLLKRRAPENQYVLRAAARSLGQIGSRAGVPALITALGTDSLSPDVKREAAHALGLIGDPAAVPALRAAMLARDPYLSQIAYESLRKIAPTEVKAPS